MKILIEDVCDHIERKDQGTAPLGSISKHAVSDMEKRKEELLYENK